MATLTQPLYSLSATGPIAGRLSYAPWRTLDIVRSFPRSHPDQGAAVSHARRVMTTANAHWHIRSAQPEFEASWRHAISRTAPGLDPRMRFLASTLRLSALTAQPPVEILNAPFADGISVAEFASAGHDQNMPDLSDMHFWTSPGLASSYCLLSPVTRLGNVVSINTTNLPHVMLYAYWTSRGIRCTGTRQIVW